MQHLFLNGKSYWFDDDGYYEPDGNNGWRRIPPPTIRPHPHMEASRETDGHRNPQVGYDPRLDRVFKTKGEEAPKAPEMIAPSVLDLPDEDLIKLLDGKK